MRYYRIDITLTGKPMGRTDEKYSIFDHRTRSFATLNQAREFLTGTYGNCKRVKMYIGEGRHIGFIYCFINKDISHDSKPWYQQDWVEVSQVDEETTLEGFAPSHRSQQ
jgi:hypothetical protein